LKIINRVFYIIGFLLVVLVVSLIVSSNSSWVIQKLANKYAPSYGVEYSSIEGNILNGVSIKNLSYEHHPIASKVTFRWNPLALVDSTLSINKLHLYELNVTAIKQIVALSSNQDDNDTKESSPLPKILIKCDSLHLDTLKFDEQNISFDKVVLDAKALRYTLGVDGVDIGYVGIDIDSNITKLKLDMALKNKKLTIKKADITKIDINSILAMQKSDSNTTQNTTETNTTTSKPNEWIPQKVAIKSLHIDTLPSVIKPVHLHEFDLNISDMDIDVATKIVRQGRVNLFLLSNLSKVSHSGRVKDNEYKGSIHLLPNKHLFELYKLPLRKEAFGDILIDFDINKELAKATLQASAKQILMLKDTNSTKEFNVDIDKLKSIVSYKFDDGSLVADTMLLVSTPYAKSVEINNHLDKNKQISYSGDIKAKKIENLDKNISKLIKDIHITYSGDMHQAKVDMNSSDIQAHIISTDMKHFDTRVYTDTIALADIAKLPPKLQKAKAKVDISVPIDINDTKNIKAKAHIVSNLVDIDSIISYAKDIKVVSTLKLPQDSLLYEMDKNLKLQALFPMSVDAKVSESSKDVTLKAKALDAKVALKGQTINGVVNLASLQTYIKGSLDGEINIDTKVSSIKELKNKLQDIYTLGSMPNVDGDLSANINIDKDKNIKLNLASSKITIKDKTKLSVINDVKFQLAKKADKIVLNSYQATYDGFKIFATKPSLIELKDSDVKLSPLWINDKLALNGDYDTLKAQGEINAIAKMLHISHKLVDLDSDIDITTSISKEQIDVNGEIVLEGGEIHYDINQKSFASDDDIVIVQNLKKKKEAQQKDNLNINLQISSKKPLVLKQKDINIKANVDLMVNKQSGSDPLVVGAIELQKGGYYIFEDKRFVLDKSYIYFTGEANKPYLDMTLKYKAIDYLIKIMISGTPNMPVISFSSQPSLTKEQILSVILFDSAEGAGNNSGEDMMRMMGGAMAKSALSSMGVKLDHLVIGNGSIEVGKKIGEKTTVIYINGEVPTIKVKYEHTPHLESVISASEKSQSYDIVYKKDYEKGSDIIFMK